MQLYTNFMSICCTVIYYLIATTTVTFGKRNFVAILSKGSCQLNICREPVNHSLIIEILQLWHYFTIYLLGRVVATCILTVHSFVIIRLIAGLIASMCKITFDTWNDILSGHDKVCMNIRGIFRILIKSFPESSIFSSLKPYLDIFSVQI